jgi:hypothetical protein
MKHELLSPTTYSVINYHEYVYEGTIRADPQTGEKYRQLDQTRRTSDRDPSPHPKREEVGIHPIGLDARIPRH